MEKMFERKNFSSSCAVLVLGVFMFSVSAFAAIETSTLPTVVITGQQEPAVQDSLPDVEGTRIYSGKKTTSVDLSQQPQIQNNNYRQAFSLLPGLLVSEQNNHGHVNLNYRGIGDPHESQDILTLKDGLPIGMERYGYSTTYFSPPLESVENVELIRGGSALLYGPQPGPALNYKTYLPVKDRKFSGATQHIMGTNNFYGTFNSMSGTVDRVGYLTNIYHSQSDGQRDNEGFNLDGGSLKLTLDADQESRWLYSLDIAENESEEPGRLTLAQYQSDPQQTLRPSDTLETKRYAQSLTFERDVSESTLSSTTLYGSYADRFSLRRTSNSSNQNNLDRREVFSGGIETRLRHDYQGLWENPNTFTGGVMIYGSDAPRSQKRSSTYPSHDGTDIFDFDYNTFSTAAFFENLFTFGDLSVAPAFRLEHINMKVKENFNTGKTSALHDIDESFTVPLFGVGFEHKLGQNDEIYTNISQGFKPPQFDTLAPSGNNTLPATDLEEGRTWTYEAGVRGKPLSWMRYDASAFLTQYKNYFGNVTVSGGQTQNQNVGTAFYHGADLGGEADVIGVIDSLTGNESELGSKLGSLSLYGNVSLLSAEFKKGPLEGKEPAYAPNYVVKTGAIWRSMEDKAKVSVLGTLVEDHFWADNNAAGTTGLTAIPAYQVWDFNTEMMVYKDNVKLFFNINNLADKQYFSRVRSDGIEPAAGRELLGGVKLLW